MKTATHIKRFQFYLFLGSFWLLLWIISFVNDPEIFVPQTLNEIWRAFYLVIVNFIFFEYILPLIIKKKSRIISNILIGIPAISSHLVLISLGLYGWTRLGTVFGIFTSFRQSTLFPGGVYNQLIDDVFYQAEVGLASVIFFGIAKLAHHNFTLRQTAQQLRLEKQQAELNYLKSQTNPHFLFNTLNNIYSLARDKSELAPESILRLSKILRFMLYETSGKYISLGQELEIITDYIALEKLRYDDSLEIKLYCEIEDGKQQLPPLLLIPLVENAFKHGASETSNESFVDIQLIASQNDLLFTVKNSADMPPGEKHVKENIGLSNLRRQLELLYTDYKLSVQHDEMVFTAILKINLASHV